MNKHCLNCGKLIGAKRRDAKFCSRECRNAHSNKRRPKRSDGGKLSGLFLKPSSQTVKTPLHISGTLSGIEKSMVPKTEQPVTENTLPVQKAESLVFSNVIYSHTGLPVHEKPKPEPPIVLPPAFLTKTITGPNPVYTDLENRITWVHQQGAIIERSIREIRAKIEEVKTTNGGEQIVLGAGIGGILGYQLGKSGAKSKASENSSGLWALVLGLAGALIGNGTRSATKQSREQQKTKDLLSLHTLLNEALKKAQAIKAESNGLNMKIFGLSKTISQQIQVTNPAYAPALKKKQAQEDRLAKAAQLGSTYPVGQDPHETGRILSAAHMSQLNTVLLNFQGVWLQLLGQPQTNFKMLVYGESGSGKSHFAIQLALYLAGFGRVLYVSGEEGFAATFQEKIKVMGANTHPNFYTGDFRTGTELLAETPDLYHFIVIDSLNDMGISYEQYLQIIERFNQSGIIGLLQCTKAGKFRGSNEFIHKSDMAVKVENGMAHTIKNRYKATGETFNIMTIYKDGGD